MKGEGKDTLIKFCMLRNCPLKVKEKKDFLRQTKVKGIYFQTCPASPVQEISLERKKIGQKIGPT